MALKRRVYTPQEFIQVGMFFLLVAVFANMVGDGRLIGAWFATMFRDQSILAKIQSVATGISILVSCASIFFIVRGLVMLRSKC